MTEPIISRLAGALRLRVDELPGHAEMMRNVVRVAELLAASCTAYLRGDEAEAIRLRDEAFAVDRVIVSVFSDGFRDRSVPRPGTAEWRGYLAKLRDGLATAEILAAAAERCTS